MCLTPQTITKKIKAVNNHIRLAKHRNKHSPFFDQMFDIVKKDAVPNHMQHIYEDQLRGADRNLKLRSYSLRSLGEFNAGKKIHLCYNLLY